LGTVNPIADDCSQFRVALSVLKKGIAKTGEAEPRVGGVVTHFSTKNKYFRMANQAMLEALNDAGISRDDLKGNPRIGMVLGTSFGNIARLEESIKNSLKKKAEAGYHPSLSATLGYLAVYLRRKYKFSGPNYTLSNTCVSGINAIGLGFHLLNSGQVDYCIVGSIEIIGDLIYRGMKALNALGSGTRLQPFAGNRSGMILGEGAGFLIFTNQKKSKSYGAITGYAITNDGIHLTAPDRQGRGLIKAMEQSMEMAGIGAKELDGIFCGGNGTLYNDAMQALAIGHLQQQASNPIPVTSIKPLIGHTLGASGTIESIAAFLMIQSGWLIPMAPDYQLDPELTPIPLLRKKVQTPINRALLISAGFSGVNGALVLERD
jgi:3-oxoacyl-(acyl-carrier-protein) synthase